MIQVDSLVTGTMGVTDKVIEGRVFATHRNGSVSVIRTDTGGQATIYQPELIGEPRPIAARRDIPDRLR